MVSSDWPSMSMNPGATTLPATSIRRAAAAPARWPIAAIRPSRMPTSAAYHGEPVPSTMCPLREDQVEGSVRGAERSGQEGEAEQGRGGERVESSHRRPLSRLLPELDAAEQAGDVLDHLDVAGSSKSISLALPPPR